MCIFLFAVLLLFTSSEACSYNNALLVLLLRYERVIYLQRISTFLLKTSRNN